MCVVVQPLEPTAATTAEGAAETPDGRLPLVASQLASRVAGNPLMSCAGRAETRVHEDHHRIHNARGRPPQPWQPMLWVAEPPT